MTKPRFDLAEGRTLGRNYYVVEYIGRGYEGEVYKVEERRTGIIRAAKIFYTNHKLPKAPMLRHATKLFKLRSCPIIIQYHHRDIATIKGEQVDILVSDFVDGEMLSTYVGRQKKKRLPDFEALHLLYELARGVERIHHLGEYHGDIHSDNVLVRRRGLGFDVHLVDFFDLGRPTKQKIQDDVIEMINLLWEMVGENDGYRQAGKEIKQIVRGRKHGLIKERYKTAGQLRLALESLRWEG